MSTSFYIASANSLSDADEKLYMDNKRPKIVITAIDPEDGTGTCIRNATPLPTKSGEFRFADEGGQVFRYPKEEWVMFRFRANNDILLVPKECHTVTNRLPKETK